MYTSIGRSIVNMRGVHLNSLIQREHERCTPQLVDPEYMQNSGVKPNSINDNKNTSHPRKGKLSDNLQETYITSMRYISSKLGYWDDC